MLYYKVINWFFKKVYKGIDFRSKSWSKHWILACVAERWNKCRRLLWDWFYNYPSSLRKEAFILNNIAMERIDMTDKLKLIVSKCKLVGYTSKLLTTSLGLDYVSDYEPTDLFFGSSKFERSVFQYPGHVLSLFKDSQGQLCCVDCSLDSIIVYRLNPDVFDFFLDEDPVFGTRSLGVKLADVDAKSRDPWLGNFSWSAVSCLENLKYQAA